MTTEHVPDLWGDRDFPVLLSLAAAEGAGRSLPREWLDAAQAALPDADEGALHLAARALIEADYLAGEVAPILGGGVWCVAERLTERGKRATGLWPSDTDIVEQFLAALAAAEESADDDEERRLLATMRDFGAGIGKGALTTVLTKFLVDRLGIP